MGRLALLPLTGHQTCLSWCRLQFSGLGGLQARGISFDDRGLTVGQLVSHHDLPDGQLSDSHELTNK